MEKILEEAYLQEFQMFKHFDECTTVIKDKGVEDVSTEGVEDAIHQVLALDFEMLAYLLTAFIFNNFLLVQMEINFAQCKQSVKNVNGKFQRETEEQIQTMRKCNTDFVKSLKYTQI